MTSNLGIFKVRAHSPGGEGGGGSMFWKTRDIGLPSYSNYLSTDESKCTQSCTVRRKTFALGGSVCMYPFSLPTLPDRLNTNL